MTTRYGRAATCPGYEEKERQAAADENNSSLTTAERAEVQLRNRRNTAVGNFTQARDEDDHTPEGCLESKETTSDAPLSSPSSPPLFATETRGARWIRRKGHVVPVEKNSSCAVAEETSIDAKSRARQG